ncbi:MAG: hypothetical protein GY792_18910 [Gammaproteobacteria bacterium]|nr:hypothetical protein [Gammaproteobacteria bacterium]
MVGRSEQGNRLLSGEHHGDDAINGDRGDDILEGGGGNDLLFGGDDNDQLYGDSGSVLMSDESTLLLRAEYHGRDTLFGNEGNDLLVGGGESDNLEGGDGADSLYGDDETAGLNRDNHGDDTLRGGSGNDLLLGNGGDDQLDGERGDDSAWGGAGGDYIAGGEGSDYLVGDNDSGNAEFDGNDTILGGTHNDTLFGLGGEDYLSGGAGFDHLSGGVGNDTLDGGSGNDFMSGEEGADSFRFHTGDGVDAVEGDADDKVILPASAEIRTTLATGVDGTDYLAIQYGASDWVLIEGGLETSIDHYDFGNGHIYNKVELLKNTLATAVEYQMQTSGEVSGGSFSDMLLGSSESDTLHGQNGDDTLIGAAGDDHLLGGEGLDVYRIGWGTGRDRISEQSDAVSRLALLPGVSIADDLNYERQGDDLFIRIKSGRDGVLLEEYYNLEQTWHISDQDNEILLNHANEPEITNAAVADSVATAWQGFNRKIESAYSGLLRRKGFGETPDGSFERSYAGGNIESRWKEFYKVTMATERVTAVSGLYERLLAGFDTSVTATRQDVEVLEEFHLGSLSMGYAKAGQSGTNYVSTGSGYRGFGYQIGDLIVADYGLNIGRSQQTGELTKQINGYWIYDQSTSSSAIAANNRSETRIYTETDYSVQINIAEIEAGSEDDEITTGEKQFNLVDGGGGNDLIDASQITSNILVPGQISLSNIQMPGALLFGNDGDDEINGSQLDDVLIGGLGWDSLLGDKGEDTYYLFDATGGDRIVEWGRDRVNGRGDDTLVLPDGVGFNDLVYEWGESVETDDLLQPDRHGRRVAVPVESMHATLKLSWNDSEGATLVLPHTDKGAGFGIERVLTSHGESRSFAAMIEDAGPGPGQDNHLLNNAFGGNGILNGAAGDDHLVAERNDYQIGRGTHASVLVGGAGVDYLEGRDGENVLIGGEAVVEAADRSPYGLRFYGTLWDAGNTFSGGKGNDELWMTAGSDSILFELGDGNDTVTDMRHDNNFFGHQDLSGWDDVYALEEGHISQLLNGHDTLKFGAGISPSDISVSSVDDNLIFEHDNGEDSVIFRNWFPANENQLNRVEFDNGAVWNQEDTLSLAAGEQIGDLPVLQAPLEDLETIISTPFSIAIPASTFIDSDEILTYRFDLEDGSPLPDWIDFDPDRMLLSGTPGEGSLGIWKLRATAADNYGQTISDLLSLTIKGVEGEILSGDGADDYLVGSSSADLIGGGGGMDTLLGGSGNDVMNGGSGRDYIDGGDEDDLIKGNSSNDRLLGGNGNDTLLGGSGKDTLDGGDDNDRIKGNSGNDRLKGGNGNDWIIGNHGRDKMYGGNGNDNMQGGRNEDSMWGNKGTDTLSGGAHNDQLYGGGGKDILRGENGDDWIEGGAGSDTLQGGSGSDTLSGGTGNDDLSGGDGDDIVLFGRDSGHDHVNMGNGSVDELDQFADRVLFAPNITPNQIWFEAQEADLDISIIGTDDRLTIQGWYANDASKADELITVDGSILTRNSVDKLVSAMAGFSPPPMGEMHLPEEIREELEPVIAVGWQ